MIKNGLFINTDKVKFRTIWLEAPISIQGPFNMIIWKLIDYIENDYDSESFCNVHELERFWKQNKVPLFDSIHNVIKLKYRNLFYDKISAFLESEEYFEISKEFQETLTIPNFILIDSFENFGSEYVQSKIEQSSYHYPFIVKPNKCFGGNYSHAKYFVNSVDGFTEMYNNHGFLQEDLIIEELIPHSEEQLIKLYWISNVLMFVIAIKTRF